MFDLRFTSSGFVCLSQKWLMSLIVLVVLLGFGETRSSISMLVPVLAVEIPLDMLGEG